MKKISIFVTLVLFILHGRVLAQQKQILPNNITGTVSFTPDSSLVIQTKEEKIYIIVPDEEVSAIFTTTNAKMFSEMVQRIPQLRDSVLMVRGTRLGSLSKIYPQQFKLFANKYKKRGLGLNGETNVYRISGYKIVSKTDEASASLLTPPVPPPGSQSKNLPVQVKPPKKQKYSFEQ